MTFSQFENFCTSLQHHTVDEDVILDLFDDAIRVTGEALGEETDHLSLEGFTQVARLHNLVSTQQFSRFVNPVAENLLEAGRQGRDTTGGAPIDKDSSKNRGKRTVIKTTSSKANDKGATHDKRQAAATQKPESVYRVIWSAVQAHFLFRHLDNAMHRELVQRMIPVPVMPGHDVIRQGDKGDYFYVAERGTFGEMADAHGVRPTLCTFDTLLNSFFSAQMLLSMKKRSILMLLNQRRRSTLASGS
jgi:hypothetical protein